MKIYVGGGNRNFGNRHALLAVLICAVVLLAVYVRYQFLPLTGGENYLVWSDANYMGGIVRSYLTSVSDILHLRRWTMTAYPPGYSIVLAAFSLLTGGSVEGLRVSQAVLDSLTAFPLFYIGFRLSRSTSIGLLVAATYALGFVFAFGAVTLLPDALSAFFIASNIALMLWARDGGPGRWASLGFICGFAGLVRPDLLLFPILLIVWWFFTNRRIRHASVMLLAFAVPLLSWGTYNYVSNGSFLISSESGAYALWSGLGELPNPYGYFLDDARADELIKSECPSCLAQGGFFSPDAQKYWMQKYFRAWQEHPAYAARVTLHRMVQIPFAFPGSHFVGLWRTPIEFYFERIGLAILGVAVLALIFYRQFATAFVISIPLIYAEMSIGLVHYEARYTRYLALSYILAPFVGFILAPKRVRTPVLAALALLLAVAAIAELPGLIEASRIGSSRPAFRELGPVNWVKRASSATLSRGAGGLSVVTDESATAYELSVEPELPVGIVAVHYRIDLQEGAIGIGILVPIWPPWLGRKHWAAMKELVTTGVNEGDIRAVLPRGGILYIVNARETAGRSRFEIEDLRVETAGSTQ